MLENKGFCDTTKGKRFIIAVRSRKGRWEKLSRIAGYKPEFFLNFGCQLGSDMREVRIQSLSYFTGFRVKTPSASIEYIVELDYVRLTRL